MQSEALNSITITRSISQHPKHIWQAWTDPERVKLWFGSDPNGSVVSADLDVKVDGGFEVSFVNSDGTGYTCYGRYMEVEPYQKLRFTWSWKDQPEIVEHVTVLLEELENGARMIFVHSDIDPRTAHSYEAGWNSTFDKLEKAIESKTSM